MNNNHDMEKQIDTYQNVPILNGGLRKEVRESHLAKYPHEEEILKPFINGFYVTWGGRKRAFNTEISQYILNPVEYMKEAYGFNNAVLLVYSNYDRIEARTIQAADSCFLEFPAKGRVETLNWILVSESNDVKEYVRSYTADNDEVKVIIALTGEEVREAKGDSFFVRNELNLQFFSRDLFDFKLPLISDTYFFGRSNLVTTLIDSVKSGKNRGIFGLRKTGKTSVLYKLRRVIDDQNIGSVFYYDCKLIRRKRWHELLQKIIIDISKKFSLSIKELSLDEKNISDSFVEFIRTTPSNQKIVLMFDEIEWISFKAKKDLHWHEDFVDFWQTIWAAQSESRHLTFLVAGVNASAVEVDIIDGVQNPLFSLVTSQYLKGFTFDETKEMVRRLGKKMGINFSVDAMEYIFQRYGGLPLFTRLACSIMNSKLLSHGIKRPYTIKLDELTADQDSRESELVDYCQHILSELIEFYPDEYKLLELLASGRRIDYLNSPHHRSQSKHLREYGLLEYDENDQLPKIRIPVVERYIGIELASKEGRKTILSVVPGQQRKDWIERRKTSISKDIRLLEKVIRQKGMPTLFGPNSFPEADRFSTLEPCEKYDQFVHFINVCNRCFVEPIENYASSMAKKNYFWDDIKNNYAVLFQALLRIRIYRNDHMHIVLKPAVNQVLSDFLEKDLEGQNPGDLEELYFMLQQCVLDGLMLATQVELNKLT
ncbi:AAA-like domain-containing protein [Paenibacillus sp. RRE4]|uniref:AAA-like domain-containing protein n=1 Tax=Paenibacillus sp. RRE4 TaxID=2962587 RepID=UPI00288280AB|nr:AAA-like domain-containing protein [Paenibacillus sp. RRE4]MDT0124580.1 AAA-like domain-containing protein [Paenibacillus sp. RRE4]